MGGSSGLVVWVAFESVELDAVQLLETLPAALTREIVLHLCRVLLHMPVERSALSALVATDLTPARSQGGVSADRDGPVRDCAIWDQNTGRTGHSNPRGGAPPWDLPYAGPGPISSLLVPSKDACHLLQGCLASVCAPVYLQVVLPFEGFATGLTGEFTNTWRKHKAEDATLGEGAMECLHCARETR